MKLSAAFKKYFLEPFSLLKKPRHMAKCAMILALSVLSSYIMSFYPSNYIKISFSFLFIAIAGMKYGPLIAASVAAISDIICFIAHPTGPYMPLLTLTTALGGLIVGLFLYKDKNSLLRIIISRLIIVVFISTLLDTYIISLLFDTMFTAFLISRMIKNIIAFPIEIILLFGILKAVKRIESKSNID